VTTALRLLGATCVAVSIAACGGNGGDGGDNDAEAEIQAMVEDLLDSFLAGDTEAIAGLFSEDCPDAQADAEAAYADFAELEVEVEYNVTGVDVRNLTDDSAEVLPEGTVILDGEEGPISSDEDEYFHAVKEDGDWKLAECDFFSGEEDPVPAETLMEETPVETVPE
jgi:uncharacterized protein (TIGR02246 family)